MVAPSPITNMTQWQYLGKGPPPWKPDASPENLKTASTVVLDFNKAINPPCVFTAYATCPLPPPQNRLPFAVTAGELMYNNHR